MICVYISIWYGCYYPQESAPYPQMGVCSLPGGPPWPPCKIIEFQPYLPDPHKLETVSPKCIKN